TLPSRVNVALGGSPRCRHDALVNDAGLVSTVVDGAPGYELWAGGSLGKAPALAVLLAPFVPRTEVLAAVVALIDVYVAHGDPEAEPIGEAGARAARRRRRQERGATQPQAAPDVTPTVNLFDNPAKGRMKYLVESLGADALRAAWQEAFAAARGRPRPPVPDVEVLAEADRREILRRVPPGGWTAGVRPQRTPGLASVTIDLPLGDTCSSELQLCCDLADRHADGHLTFNRDQNICFRNVPLAGVATIRAALLERGVYLLGEGETAQIRACTGSAVCALGITDAPGAGRGLAAAAALARNSALRVHVSGCPNSCAQHQIGDIGLAGSKVRVDGQTTDGYQVYLGADLDRHILGEVVGRVAARDLDAAVAAIVGTWEALRHPDEPLGRTVRRLGAEAFSLQIQAALAERWAPGPEPGEAPVDAPALATPT
ncbi:MAG TPA: hypothetical protein VE575_07240, partial [Acidimicrobiales bacterium]|nr:hypothetical protein [Acidimicrobiales bacterium]